MSHVANCVHVNLHISYEHGQFISLVKYFNTDRINVSYHSSFRWLSLSTVLKRAWGLQDGILMFLEVMNKDLIFQ
jgi:hypothetical protein